MSITLIIVIVIVALFAAVTATKSPAPSIASVLLFSFGFGIGIITPWERLMDGYGFIKSNFSVIKEFVASKLNVGEMSGSVSGDGGTSKTDVAKVAGLAATVVFGGFAAIKALKFVYGFVAGLFVRVLMAYFGLDLGSI